LAFIFFLSFFVASHTITALAAITSTAISAVTGTTSTVMGRSKATARDLTAQNKLLRTDLDDVRRRNSGLVADNARLRRENIVTFRGRPTIVRQASREVLDSTMARTTRSTLANVSSIPGESIPVYGIAIVLAATAYEINAACDNMKDLYELQVAIDPESARSDDKNSVCAIELPTKEQLWQNFKDSPQTTWDASIAKIGDISDSVTTMEPPEFGGMWQRFMNWVTTRL